MEHNGRNGDTIIPDIVIRRLPIYVRTLRQIQSAGTQTVSSDELAERIGVTAAQIRRDLSYFGRFGKQGKGYDVGSLLQQIQQILNLDTHWDVALVGYGHLGRAIASYRGFEPSSFRISAIFDRTSERNGQMTSSGIEVRHSSMIPDVVRRQGIQIGIVAVPATDAQDVADLLVKGGVRAILNYAPVTLKVPEGVWVREIDPISAMQSMTYYLEREQAREGSSRNIDVNLPRPDAADGS
jgi:redox-sensing transcriptional repressor